MFGFVNGFADVWIHGCFWIYRCLFIHKHGISRAETQFTWCFAQKTSGMSHKISIRQCIWWTAQSINSTGWEHFLLALYNTANCARSRDTILHVSLSLIPSSFQLSLHASILHIPFTLPSPSCKRSWGIMKESDEPKDSMYVWRWNYQSRKVWSHFHMHR